MHQNVFLTKYNEFSNFGKTYQYEKSKANYNVKVEGKEKAELTLIDYETTLALSSNLKYGHYNILTIVGS